MTENNYEKFRVHSVPYTEPSARMNIVKEESGFRVEYPELKVPVLTKEFTFEGKKVVYQKFTELNSRYDIYMVGGIKVDSEEILEDGKRYVKVKPIENEKSKKNIASLLSPHSGKVEFL